MNEIFVKLVNMSVSAGWLILAVLVLRLPLKRAPRWITCLLWALVAVRLVCPVTLRSPVSAYQVAAPAAVQPSGQVEYFQYVHDSGDKPSIQLDVEAIAPAAESAGHGEAAQPDVPARQITRFLPPYVAIYLTVAAALLLYGLASTLRLRYRVREAMRLRDNIWVCDAVTSPFLLGVLHPRIYLPSGMDEGKMSYVIAHENAHLRRGDQFWKPLGFVLLAVHWFNPLVWLAYWLFCRDIETACDERVIAGLNGEDKKAYSLALLDCSQGRRMVLACPLAFGEEGVKSRVKSVLRYKKPAFWVVLAAVVLCAAVAVCFLTDPVGGAKGTLTFVEKENIVSDWRADFAVDTSAAALDAAVYAEVWRDGQCETTPMLTVGCHANELSVQIEQAVREQQYVPYFALRASSDVYGSYAELTEKVKQLPKDTAYAAYRDGQQRQVAAGDDIVLLAMAADLGGGLPQFDCRRLERDRRLPRSADFMIVVRASFTAAGPTPSENLLGKDTDSAHEVLLPLFRLPVEVELNGVEDTGSVQSLDTLINDHRWAMPARAESTGAAPSITLYASTGDTLHMESGMDALLWVNANGDPAGLAGDMTGDDIISALSGWAWQMKRNIARSREAIPDGDTLFTRFPDGGFRWDIYAQSGSDAAVLLTLLREYARTHTLTADQCRALLLSHDGLDGANTGGYTALLAEIYQKDETAYLQAWRGLTYEQQQDVPRDAEGVLPQPEGIRWSYRADALDAPYMTVDRGGSRFYMEIPDALAQRIRQRLAENVRLPGFEPPADTRGWSRSLVSWTAESAEVYLHFPPEESGAYSLRRGDGGVWGIGTDGGVVQADAEVRELLSMIASLTGWQTGMGRESFFDLTAAELIYNGKTLHTVTDRSHLAQLQELLQNGTQCSYASKTPMERVQLRLTRGDGSTVSVLLDTDSPRIYLPPFYYYVYNDYESTGTRPLLDALGLTAWPSGTADEDCGAWLTALEEQLAPMPRGEASGSASRVFPLSGDAVNDALTAVGLPVRINDEETQSYTEGQIAYTLRNDGEDLYPWGAVVSALYDGGKRYLQVNYQEAAGEDTTFRWEDWQKTIHLAAILYGGFTDDGQLYRQLSALPIPGDAADGAAWDLNTNGAYCYAYYSTLVVQGEPRNVSLTICFYDSEQYYWELRKQTQQNREEQMSQLHAEATGK